MGKLNFLLYLNAYDDQNSSNAPNRSIFKWTRDANSIFINNAGSLEFSLAPGETRMLFSGSRTLTQDGTTQYSIALVPFSTTMYQLSWISGTAPTFRTLRAPGSNASTMVTVTTNGPVVTFTSTSGTMFNLISGGVVVGDIVNIGNNFNIANQGQWQIISVSNTSFSVANPLGVAQSPVSLGSGYANQVRIFSAAGVQAGDTLVISGGFSPVTQGSYIITQVTDSSVQFSSLNTLPQEVVTTDDIAIYFAAKKLVYMESDQNVSLTLNGSIESGISPIVKCGCPPVGFPPGKPIPGMFLRTDTIYSISVTNNSVNTANLFFASVD